MLALSVTITCRIGQRIDLPLRSIQGATIDKTYSISKWFWSDQVDWDTVWMIKNKCWQGGERWTSPHSFTAYIVSLGEQEEVDGGTGSQVFVYPAASNWRKITEKLKVQGTPQIYVIRNAFLEPDYRGVNRTLLPIASRSIDSLIRTQGLGDLYQIFALSKRDGNDFNLASIPADFAEEPEEGFDPVYMTKLFERGYEMAVKGYPWEKEPPGFIQFQDWCTYHLNSESTNKSVWPLFNNDEKERKAA